MSQCWPGLGSSRDKGSEQRGAPGLEMQNSDFPVGFSLNSSAWKILWLRHPREFHGEKIGSPRERSFLGKPILGVVTALLTHTEYSRLSVGSPGTSRKGKSLRASHWEVSLMPSSASLDQAVDSTLSSGCGWEALPEAAPGMSLWNLGCRIPACPNTNIPHRASHTAIPWHTDTVRKFRNHSDHQDTPGASPAFPVPVGWRGKVHGASLEWDVGHIPRDLGLDRAGRSQEPNSSLNQGTAPSKQLRLRAASLDGNIRGNTLREQQPRSKGRDQWRPTAAPGEIQV